jgi:hypothetical protein
MPSFLCYCTQCDKAFHYMIKDNVLVTPLYEDEEGNRYCSKKCLQENTQEMEYYDQVEREQDEKDSYSELEEELIEAWQGLEDAIRAICEKVPPPGNADDIVSQCINVRAIKRVQMVLSEGKAGLKPQWKEEEMGIESNKT